MDINQIAGLQTYFLIFRIFAFCIQSQKWKVDKSASPSGMAGLCATKEKVLIQMHFFSGMPLQKLNSLSIKAGN